MNINKIFAQKPRRTFGKILLALIMPFLVVQINFAQNIKTTKKDEISVELRKDAVNFLRETAAGNLYNKT
ncbi:MAG: hypothetical protein WKF90_01175 [Pyrinomonadaceae bacterium]|jgi:hypothetical protein